MKKEKERRDNKISFLNSFFVSLFQLFYFNSPCYFIVKRKKEREKEKKEMVLGLDFGLSDRSRFWPTEHPSMRI